ncbi:MAG TPA: UDP-N-acetylmuramoyl-L-alanyl-D-glutamate--2,6-diaminopimelate ligase [Rhizomicrobium sp.]|nr:UDP-N-acetylmuramoyl-L-alanyl-D-glutamate--2,6-diaminopimelate ligase [Rhizomicrobium sp.]
MRDFSGLASDSRAVRPGYLFAALPGAKANGAAYIADAVKRGAVAVLGRPDARADAEKLGVRFIADENPRARLARFAAAFYGAQPRIVAAVTGTNGKTSVAVFLRQIWRQLGHDAASMGTIGVVTKAGEIALRHTTPDPVELHALLARLAREGVDHLSLEASSHGLDQHRLDGVDIAAAGFTNITRDHLDYHPTFADYLAAKLRLFTEVVREGGVAVIDMDAPGAAEVLAAAKARGLGIVTVGERGETLKLAARVPHGDGQTLSIAGHGEVELPLAGSFQASNALVAAGLAIGLGDPAGKVLATLAHLKGAPGRLEKVAYAKSGAPVYVDYAHTPDALQTVLAALRPHIEGKLAVVFGCGGDRDRGKRPLMGKAAAKFADAVIITDDNPRGEDPAAIRREALAGAREVDAGAREIGDRAEAIAAGIAMLGAGDGLVIAGKGHEQGQIVGAVTRPFRDRDEAIKAALALGGRPA